MSSRRHAVTAHALPRPQVVDLVTVKPAELEGLWQDEVRWWRERLRWDISPVFAAFRGALERAGVRGKAVRVGSRTVGYTTYSILHGRLGVLTGYALLPDWNRADVGEPLLLEAIDDLRRQGVRRIETQFIACDCPWLPSVFERAGFATSWREFLRLDLHTTSGHAGPGAARLPARFRLEPWQHAYLREAAQIMCMAYHDGVDAEIHELYQTPEGCWTILENIVYQGGSGRLLSEASALARHRGQGIGFIVITEIAPRQGHLAQVAVSATYQHRGVGRSLLRYSVLRLTACEFDTLSLIVSRANHHALRMYQSSGFRSICAFPVFAWDQLKIKIAKSGRSY